VRGLIIVIAAGCGRVGFDPIDGARAIDACSFGPFSAPVRLDASLQSVADDWFPTPVLDGRQLYFYSYRPPSAGADLWVVPLATPTLPASAPRIVAELATSEDERGPTLTRDALDIVYGSHAVASGQLPDLMSARWNAAATSWDPPSPISELNTIESEDTPWLSEDGLRLFFASSRPGVFGFLDLYEATRSDRTSPWEAPRHVQELSTTLNDSTPTTSSDGLVIFFGSSRVGGPGGMDVYTAKRPALDQPFGAAEVVTELSSTRDEYGLRLSSDGRTMYLNYDTLTNGGGFADMWIAR
jgi:hypothetical protein